MRQVLTISTLAFLFLTGFYFKQSPNANGGKDVNLCNLYGRVYIETVAGFADYKVFVEPVEGFSDLVVYKEEVAGFANQNGLWQFTDNRAFADFSIFIEQTKGFSDFSVHYTDVRGFAGCRKK